MEENSGTRLETEVSSTTADLSDMQEVTGSHGNVEMVIVVEKMEEDDSNSQPEKALASSSSPKDNDFSSCQYKPIQSPEKTLENETKILENIKVSQNDSKSQRDVSPLIVKKPIKIIRPAKPIQNSPIKQDLQVIKTTLPSVKLQQVDILSLNCENQKHQVAEPLQKIETQKSPNKDIFKPEVEKSPIKENSIKIDIKKSQDKDDTACIASLITNNIDVEESLQKNSSEIVEMSKSDPKSPMKDSQQLKSVQNNEPPESEEVLNTNTSTTSTAEKPNLDVKIQNRDDNKEEKVVVVTSLDMSHEKETSNDSQMETGSETSEREHNKSISRELKSLINSAKESKIISECTQLTSKTRKSRTNLDNSCISLNSSMEADKIQGVRRGSSNSQKSNCSEKSEKAMKRSMRSQNPEFVHKVKRFLNSVTGKMHKSESDGTISDEDMDETKTNDKSEPILGTPKRNKLSENSVPEKCFNKLQSDPYCWRCHWAIEPSANEKTHAPMQCTVCPRSFHYKCLTVTERIKINLEKSWVCPECLVVLHAESSETRSHAMKKISLGTLCDLLKHALARMMEVNGVEPFMNPVDRSAFPDYDTYVVHPMDLSIMKENIALGQYGSTEAFLADAQWILHNSIIFNTCEMQSKLTAAARALVRSCRTEMGEIEACPECYAGAHARKPTWFTDVCSTPHILLWAKLKGFPYWPAKGMSVSTAGHVDVRFFGAHDRAWVPARDCFLYSEKDPNNFRTKRQDIIDSMQEAENHIGNISRKYGKFVYPPFKTTFDPTKLNEQLKMMIPSFEGDVVQPSIKEKHSPASLKVKSRSNSKGSKDSPNDGDTSEGEEILSASRKNPIDTEEDREDYDICVDKDETMDMNVSQNKEAETRKRRRSDLEEAVITVIDTSSIEKRKRIESVEKEDKSENKLESDVDSRDNNSRDDKDRDDKNKDDKGDNNKVQKSAPLEEAVITIMENNSCEKFPTGIRQEPTNKGKNHISQTVEENITKKLSSIGQSAKTDMIVSKVEENKLTKTPYVTLTVQQDKNKATTIKIISTTESPPAKQTTKVKDKEKDMPTPKEKEKESEKSLLKQKPTRREKSSSNEKDKSIVQDEKTKKTRKSITIKSKPDKQPDKKNEYSLENSNTKDKVKENDMSKNNSIVVDIDKPTSVKNTSTPKATTSKSTALTKDRIQFDDDTTLAVIAREVAKNSIVVNNVPGLPTISSVQSLSTDAQIATTKSSTKTIEVTVESSIFTPTSTDNVRSMKEAVNKLQKLRNDVEPSMVGRVGVRAFARMTSPPEKGQPSKNDDNAMQVEIKAEPMDYEDAERQQQIAFVNKALSLHPVSVTSSSSLRDVRINKVISAPNTRKTAPKPPEIRPRAKKTFPQPRKADDGRSELNSKNSMVYIPIQPPITQAPVRAIRPVAATNGPMTSSPATRPPATIITSTANNMVNTVTPPLIPLSISSPTPTSTPSSVATSLCSAPTVGQVPTTVHTMPLITSVNGQWTFSLQPVLSVGGVDSATSPPTVNGLPERASTVQTLALVPAGSAPPAPAAPPAVSSSPALACGSPATSLVSTALTRPSVDRTPGEPPRLQQRPPLVNPLDPNAPVGGIPAPSTVGPVTAKLNQNAVKLTDFFRTLLEDSLEKVDEPVAQLTALKLQLEQSRWQHQNEIDELKHNHELITSEMRTSFEKEKARAVNEARRAAQLELEAAVKHAKSKQWCANCSQEAQFYCCWNTSYCDYPCQRAHWSQHYSVCTQHRSQNSNSNSTGEGNNPEKRLQPAPENLPALQKSTAAPALTVGGKPVSSRSLLNYEQPQKTSIIVSMVDDNNGNQTMKCVGTYKPPSVSQPLILNKQLMINEESTTKKVVTSGGYLIVGAGTSAAATAPLVTSSQRAHSIQYYS